MRQRATILFATLKLGVLGEDKACGPAAAAAVAATAWMEISALARAAGTREFPARSAAWPLSAGFSAAGSFQADTFAGAGYALGGSFDEGSPTCVVESSRRVNPRMLPILSSAPRTSTVISDSGVQ